MRRAHEETLQGRLRRAPPGGLDDRQPRRLHRHDRAGGRGHDPGPTARRPLIQPCRRSGRGTGTAHRRRPVRPPRAGSRPRVVSGDGPDGATQARGVGGLDDALSLPPGRDVQGRRGLGGPHRLRRGPPAGTGGLRPISGPAAGGGGGDDRVGRQDLLRTTVGDHGVERSGPH